MKKYFYILLLGVLIASCTKDEPLAPSSANNPAIHQVKVFDITDPDKGKGHDGDGTTITDPDKEDDHDKEKKIKSKD